MSTLSEILNPSTTGTIGRWPPLEHSERIQAYEKNEIIWNGDPQEVQSIFVNANTRVYGQYTSVNIAKNIVTIPADFLFGEEIDLDFEDDVKDKDRQRVEDIWKRNNLQQLCYENAIDTGIKGDGLFVVGRGDDKLATVTTQSADFWFPEHEPDDIRKIKKHVIAWRKTLTEGGKKREFLRIREHERGVIRNYLKVMKGTQVTSVDASPSDWAAFYGDNIPTETIETLVDDFMVVHVPNFRIAREYFGRSEYSGLESMFAAIDARFTQIDGILDRHSNPQMGLPAEITGQLMEGGKKDIDLADLDYFAIVEGQNPFYLTWDGKLADNFQFIDKAVNLVALISETAPQLLNIGEWGSEISGKALKVLLIRTLAKVNRKRNYFEQAIKKVLELAQRIEGVEKPVDVKVVWPDGLPQDVMEQVEEINAEIGAGLESRRGGIMRLRGVDKEKADEIIAEIDADDKAQASALTGGRPKPMIPVNVNLGGEE